MLEIIKVKEVVNKILFKVIIKGFKVDYDINIDNDPIKIKTKNLNTIEDFVDSASLKIHEKLEKYSKKNKSKDEIVMDIYWIFAKEIPIISNIDFDGIPYLSIIEDFLDKNPI